MTRKQGVALLVSATLACCFVLPSNGANILALFPVGGKSHWIVFREMLVELGRRGHHLTVVTPFKEEHKNWELLKMADPVFDLGGFTFFSFGRLPPALLIMFMLYGSADECREYMEDEALRTLIDSRDRKFDLVILETFFNECLLAFAHKFGTPVVQAVALGGGASWMNDMVGNPYPLAYVPETCLPYTSNMNLFQRANNVFTASLFRLYRQFFYLPAMDRVVKEYFKDITVPPIAELERNTSLLLLNSHFSFQYARPFVPNAVEVAGMHIRPPKKLPQDLQKFLDAATDGVIYFSLGSNVQSADLPEDIINVFLGVFSKLKEKIIWKFETDTLANPPDNLKIGKWFPQSDILAHKSIKLFMTHGGMMGLQEALHNGVPLLGFPVFGDQTPNLIKAQDSGYGIMLNFNNVTEASLSWALKEILTNPRYMENAKKYSRLFHDRPEKPLDTAINSIEYVLRHGGARHMRSAALDLTWYQYLLLDVILFLLACAAAAVAAAVVAVKVIVRLISSKSGSASKKGKGAKKD
ncbi:UDP-glucosyltransferase 2-like isoform X2 [Schistocerca serialis cubense]|uniref:UDP-glucosyltransferase 2-like isoform X2 n=1 Tax=Schistocerca serialis cubense TaxID=2023355 RepID=UPI00214F290D|nr:UDP-glucosyltransferase 2-like isoform X2 [Schistocerca serialis cubense]